LYQKHFSDDCLFVNGFGPTEATVGAVSYDVDLSAPARAETVPLGRPLANVKVFILDEQMRVRPEEPRTAEADSAMQALTRELIDASLSSGGRYYLPYRLHASRDQFQRAYPRYGDFFALKRAIDPA